MAIGYNPRIVTSGLILCLDAANTKSYPGSGTAWTDLSSLGNNSTLVNGPTYGITENGIITFDGSNDYVDTNYDLSWNHTNSATVDFWCNPSTIRNVGIIGKGLDWEWQVIQNNSSLQFVYWNTGGGHTNGPIPSISNVFTVDVWKNITVVWSHTANQLYLYVNGILVSTSDWIDASINQNRTNSVKIGGAIYDWQGGGSYWAGRISSVKFYNKALSVLEVQQNFQALRGRYGI